MGKLNKKQELFCQEYMVDLNATQSAIRAGYSERTAYSQGQRLLKHVEVASRIGKLMKTRSDRLGLDAYWVLKRLMDVSDRSMQAEPVMTFDRSAGGMIETGEYEFDSQGANRSTELIGRHIGMFDPKLELQKRMLEAQIKKILKDIEVESSTEDKLQEYFEKLDGAFDEES